jgi:hypothetical protein
MKSVYIFDRMTEDDVDKHVVREERNRKLSIRGDETIPEHYVQGFRKDVLFIKMINAYERAAASMRYLQSITESASYMLIMGSIGGILFIWLGYIAIKTYFDVADWIPIYSSRLQDFNKLKTYDMGRSFLDNKQIFFGHQILEKFSSGRGGPRQLTLGGCSEFFGEYWNFGGV